MTRRQYCICAFLILLLLPLSACGREPQPTPAPTPVATALPATSPSRSTSGAVTASAVLVPQPRAQMSFTIPGRVASLPVHLGDQVRAGDPLLTLHTSALEAGVAQAQANLQLAQANLALLRAGPRAEDRAIADAQLRAAQAALTQALAQRDQLQLADVTAARAALVSAMLEQKAAEDAYSQIEGNVHGWIEEQAILALRAAELARAAAEAQLTQLEADDGAQARSADAAVAAAAAQRDIAQAQLDIALSGPTPEQLAAAQAAVDQAQAALDAALAALDQAILRALFDGTVAALDVSPGETVLPGQIVVALADLDHLQLETTDLSERDVDQIAVGQPVIVYVEALGEQIEGQVVGLASQATTVGGDVVFKVVVELDEQLPGLRWGMSADVEIDTR
jgi:multidrug efflux pump subunit AcrA (membrane-fusion protein)